MAQKRKSPRSTSEKFVVVDSHIMADKSLYIPVNKQRDPEAPNEAISITSKIDIDGKMRLCLLTPTGEVLHATLEDINSIPVKQNSRLYKTIAERDADTDIDGVLWGVVLDATGDATVTRGGALYIRASDQWIKFSEQESLDIQIKDFEMGMRMTGDTETAFQFWEAGKLTAVMTYNMENIRMTLNDGSFGNPIDGNSNPLPEPFIYGAGDRVSFTWNYVNKIKAKGNIAIRGGNE